MSSAKARWKRKKRRLRDPKYWEDKQRIKEFIREKPEISVAELASIPEVKEIMKENRKIDLSVLGGLVRSVRRELKKKEEESKNSKETEEEAPETPENTLKTPGETLETPGENLENPEEPPQPPEETLETPEKPSTPLEKTPPPYNIYRETPGVPPGEVSPPRGLGREGAEKVAVDLMEREISIRATPIIWKVVLNPKVWLWYDYARSKGYDGDIGSFLVECVEDFWRSRGYKIKIVQEEEVG